MNDESIDAEKRANEITDWLNDLNVRVAVDICRAYTNHKQNDKNEEKNARDKSDENNVSDKLVNETPLNPT